MLPLPLLLRGASQRPSGRDSRAGMRSSCPARCQLSCLSGLALVFEEPLHLERSHAAWGVGQGG